MKTGGVVRRTCSIVEALVRGSVHDRHTLAEAFGVTVAAADRYIAELEAIPGMVVVKSARRRTIEFRFTDALRAGRGVS